MAEIRGFGLSHYPPLSGTDDAMAGILRGTLKRPDIPEAAKQVDTWPAPMRAEWGEDEGRTAAVSHRAEFVKHCRAVRAELDSFNPDVVIMFGDDQYENFHEDIIPPFCVYAWDDFEATPHKRGERLFPDNIWGEPVDLTIPIKGHREAGKHVTRGLLERSIDISYSYKPLHFEGLSHAFLCGITYLDYDRVGWPYPTVPVAVNCYGSNVIGSHGSSPPVGKIDRDLAELDPPGPSPQRCMTLGAALADICRESPWKVALVASSGWSHAFLTKKHNLLYPDVDQDRRLYEALAAGDFDFWRSVTTPEVEDSGDQEALNWWVLMGAMEALGLKTPDYRGYLESYVFNSNKCFAVWKPS